MLEIADWLKKLGMSEYAARFVENRIDFSVLRDLTDQDLKDLGVVLGDRRRLLRAIGELDGGPTPAPAVSVSQDTAERRQVTVMFCDLVGSTALSARMDPEDLREVVSAYHKCAAEMVRRFGGFVSQYLGDGVLVYFGYPQAHEDDAERAVRAGLELIEITAAGAIGATIYGTSWLSHLALAHADLGEFDDAWRCIGEAMTVVETATERWYEAEINRIAGEIALKSPAPDAAKAQAYFARALAVARTQQAKSWEPRAATSMARLLRDQGKRDAARDLLAPVYNWFTEGYDTLDLKDAKVLLAELA